MTWIFLWFALSFVSYMTPYYWMCIVPEPEKPILVWKATWYDYTYKWIEVTKIKNTCALRIMERYGLYKVCNVDNWRCIVCVQTDFGPEEYTNKIIDISSYAFKQLAPLSRGVINVEIYKLET